MSRKYYRIMGLNSWRKLCKNKSSFQLASQALTLPREYSTSQPMDAHNNGALEVV